MVRRVASEVGATEEVRTATHTAESQALTTTTTITTAGTAEVEAVVGRYVDPQRVLPSGSQNVNSNVPSSEALQHGLKRPPARGGGNDP
jgi:hypothetical protein